MTRDRAKDWVNAAEEADLPAIRTDVKSRPVLPAVPASLVASGAQPVIDDFQRRVADLTQTVIFKETPLDQLEIPEQGEARERLKSAIKRRIIATFDRIQTAKTAEGNTAIINPIRRRLAKLFNLEEDQFAPSIEQMRQELLNHGYVYLPGIVVAISPDCLEAVKIRIETVFIEQCQNVDQQRQVIRLTAGITDRDFKYIGRLGGYSLFKLKESILNKLISSSISLPGSSAQPDMNNLSGDWDWDLDVDWTPFIDPKKR